MTTREIRARFRPRAACARRWQLKEPPIWRLCAAASLADSSPSSRSSASSREGEQHAPPQASARRGTGRRSGHVTLRKSLPPPAGESEATSALTSSSAQSVPKPCTRPVLPGTDSTKPLGNNCADPVVPAKPQSVIDAQRAYLAEWQKEAKSWTGLTDAEKEARRRALKVKHLGGQP